MILPKSLRQDQGMNPTDNFLLWVSPEEREEMKRGIGVGENNCKRYQEIWKNFLIPHAFILRGVLNGDFNTAERYRQTLKRFGVDCYSLDTNHLNSIVSTDGYVWVDYDKLWVERNFLMTQGKTEKQVLAYQFGKICANISQDYELLFDSRIADDESFANLMNLVSKLYEQRQQLVPYRNAHVVYYYGSINEIYLNMVIVYEPSNIYPYYEEGSESSLCPYDFFRELRDKGENPIELMNLVLRKRQCDMGCKYLY